MGLCDRVGVRGRVADHDAERADSRGGDAGLLEGRRQRGDGGEPRGVGGLVPRGGDLHQRVRGARLRRGGVRLLSDQGDRGGRVQHLRDRDCVRRRPEQGVPGRALLARPRGVRERREGGVQGVRDGGVLLQRHRVCRARRGRDGEPARRGAARVQAGVLADSAVLPCERCDHGHAGSVHERPAGHRGECVRVAVRHCDKPCGDKGATVDHERRDPAGGVLGCECVGVRQHPDAGGARGAGPRPAAASVDRQTGPARAGAGHCDLLWGPGVHFGVGRLRPGVHLALGAGRHELDMDLGVDQPLPPAKPARDEKARPEPHAGSGFRGPGRVRPADCGDAACGPDPHSPVLGRAVSAGLDRSGRRPQWRRPGRELLRDVAFYVHHLCPVLWPQAVHPRLVVRAAEQDRRFHRDPQHKRGAAAGGDRPGAGQSQEQVVTRSNIYVLVLNAPLSRH